MQFIYLGILRAGALAALTGRGTRGKAFRRSHVSVVIHSESPGCRFWVAGGAAGAAHVPYKPHFESELVYALNRSVTNN